MLSAGEELAKAVNLKSKMSHNLEMARDRVTELCECVLGSLEEGGVCTCQTHPLLCPTRVGGGGGEGGAGAEEGGGPWVGLGGGRHGAGEGAGGRRHGAG